MNQLFTSTSRVLTAFLFVAVATESAAQSFPLPYNPDENGDGLIGVVDLQGLLTNYGSEFSGAVISEDGESAITYMGDMAYPLCALSCENLPGMWHMATMSELAMVWQEVYTINEYTETWVGNHEKRVFDNSNEFLYFDSDLGGNSPQNHTLIAGNRPAYQRRCYCAAKQLPRVEYSYCDGGNIEECTSTKVQEGWYPLSGISTHENLGYSSNGYQTSGNTHHSQAFWRWAE